MAKHYLVQHAGVELHPKAVQVSSMLISPVITDILFNNVVHTESVFTYESFVYAPDGKGTFYRIEVVPV
jgi:hypothetical protein